MFFFVFTASKNAGIWTVYVKIENDKGVWTNGFMRFRDSDGICIDDDMTRDEWKKGEKIDAVLDFLGLEYHEETITKVPAHITKKRKKK